MKGAKFFAEIDPVELACRIAEGIIGAARPEGKTAKEALDQFPDADRVSFYRAANKAATYLAERVNQMKREQ